MTTPVAERITWAVQTLDLRPDDRVLEIGCGAGVAVSLICEALGQGRITAIDRSRPMVEQARRRNRAHVAAGKAQIDLGALDTMDFDGQRFDKVLAINVGVFAEEPVRELDAVRAVLAPKGRLYLVMQPPIAAKTRPLADRMVRGLEEGGFSINGVSNQVMRPAPAACVVATLTRPPSNPRPRRG